MRQRLTGLLAALAIVYAGAPARAADKAQIEAWEKTARDGSVSQSYYEQYTKDLKPEAGVKLRKEASAAAASLLDEESIRISPAKFAVFACILAELHVNAARPDAGGALFRQVAAMKDAPQQETILAYMGLANIECARGNLAEAARHCRDLVNRVPPETVPRRTARQTFIYQAKAAADLLTGYHLDALKLPFDTGAKAFPTPKEAKYTDGFVKLTSVRVTGLKDDAPGMRLLKEKLARFGIEVAKKAPFTIAVNAGALKAPEKPQGYALAVTKDGAQIAGSDNQGTTWGIVSLIQVIDQGDKAARICEIRDWPDGLRRGHTGWFANEIEYALFTKQNLCTGGPGAWFFPSAYENMRFPALQDAIIAACARPFADFGFDYYPCERMCQVPISIEQGYQWYLARALAAAEAGAHTYYMWDDGRYTWLYPNGPYELDRKASGMKPGKMDAAFLDRIYREVKARHPGFKLIFCPPCYWGPDAAFDGPQDRESYLAEIGTTDPAIDVFWTGAGVLSRQHTPAAVAWFKKLLKRNPTIFQNRTGQHESLNYLADATDWPKWVYEGFAANDISGFAKNAGMPQEGTQIATLSDYLWNNNAYDAEKSLENAMNLLFGKGVYELLRPAAVALAYFDRLQPITPAILDGKVPDLQAKVDLAKANMEKARKLNSTTLNIFSAWYGHGVSRAEAVVAKAKNPPDFAAARKKVEKDIAATEALAAKLAGYVKAKGDLFFCAADFSGLRGFSVSRHVMFEGDNRLTGILYGADTANHTATFEFEANAKDGPIELRICGADDERDSFCGLRVTVNDSAVFDANGQVFPNRKYTVIKVPVAANLLRGRNKIQISNPAPGDNPRGTPWVAINFVVIKR